jgi:hypothetical protein|tara:strand:- start:6322 stop:6837 length:516 start_codon:yes stop_codon:yes gene_type:complete
VSTLIKQSNIPTPPIADEGAIGVGRGPALMGEPTSIYDDEEDFFIPDEPVDSGSGARDIYEEVVPLLLELGDGLDQNGDEESVRLASFADFLLKKISEHKREDYAKLFNLLLVKISDSDILDSNNLLLRLTKLYSRAIAFRVTSGLKREDAEREAYMKAVRYADTFIGEGM